LLYNHHHQIIIIIKFIIIILLLIIIIFIIIIILILILILIALVSVTVTGIVIVIIIIIIILAIVIIIVIAVVIVIVIVTVIIAIIITVSASLCSLIGLGGTPGLSSYNKTGAATRTSTFTQSQQRPAQVSNKNIHSCWCVWRADAATTASLGSVWAALGGRICIFSRYFFSPLYMRPEPSFFPSNQKIVFQCLPPGWLSAHRCSRVRTVHDMILVVRKTSGKM